MFFNYIVQNLIDGVEQGTTALRTSRALAVSDVIRIEQAGSVYGFFQVTAVDVVAGNILTITALNVAPAGQVTVAVVTN